MTAAYRCPFCGKDVDMTNLSKVIVVPGDRRAHERCGIRSAVAMLAEGVEQ